jgi:hypothetical protein
MESPDEVGGDEIRELFALTDFLERQIQGFSFTGSGVSGDIEVGFSVEPSPDLEEES